MNGVRDKIRAGAGWVFLLALGLALGFALQLIKSDRKGIAAVMPWTQGPTQTVSTPAEQRTTPDDVDFRKLPPFTLRATIVASDPASSTAIFDFGKGQIHSLRPGTTLPGVGLLVSVSNNSVQLVVSGQSVSFSFNDSTLGPGEVLVPIQSLATEILANGPEGSVLQEASVARSASRSFVVPVTAIRYSDAPRDEPELNATPKPGQSIDTTVWD